MTCSWYTAPRALFSSRPHLVLQEGSWDEVAQTRTERLLVGPMVSAESVLDETQRQLQFELRVVIRPGAP